MHPYYTKNDCRSKRENGTLYAYFIFSRALQKRMKCVKSDVKALFPRGGEIGKTQLLFNVLICDFLRLRNR
jgi:hypothetical protein